MREKHLDGINLSLKVVHIDDKGLNIIRLNYMKKFDQLLAFLFENYEDETNWDKLAIEHYNAKNILDIMISVNE